MQSYVVNIKKNDHDFTERELNILKALLLNRIGMASVKTINKSMALNPLEMSKDDLFNYEIVLESAVDEKEGEELYKLTERFINSALKLSTIDDYDLKITMES